MNINTQIDITYSDNSHIFGIPILFREGFDGYMDIPIIEKDGHRSFEGLGEWIEKVSFFEKAGIEMHLHYVAKEE